MAFYQKTLLEAVQLCKERRGVLVVFIRNNNEASISLEKILEDSDVVSIIQARDEAVFLVRIEQGTRAYDKLRSKYHVASIPAIHFIDGANGLLLFTSTASHKEGVINDLLEGLDTWQRRRSDIPTASITSSQNISTSSQQPATVAQPTASTPDIQAPRTQERVAEIRRRREKEAEAAEKEKEAKRREDGQLAKATEKQRQERLAEQTRQDMEKERRQEAAHRQKIPDQLKQDKEDRARRIEANKESQSNLPTTTCQYMEDANLATIERLNCEVLSLREQLQEAREDEEDMRSFFEDLHEKAQVGRLNSLEKYIQEINDRDAVIKELQQQLLEKVTSGGPSGSSQQSQSQPLKESQKASQPAEKRPVPLAKKSPSTKKPQAAKTRPDAVQEASEEESSDSESEKEDDQEATANNAPAQDTQNNTQDNGDEEEESEEEEEAPAPLPARLAASKPPQPKTRSKAPAGKDKAIKPIAGTSNAGTKEEVLATSDEDSVLSVGDVKRSRRQLHDIVFAKETHSEAVKSGMLYVFTHQEITTGTRYKEPRWCPQRVAILQEVVAKWREKKNLEPDESAFNAACGKAKFDIKRMIQ